MSTVAEIESAIERLQPSEVARLAAWFSEYQQMILASWEIFSMYDREEPDLSKRAESVRLLTSADTEHGFIDVCAVEDIPEKRTRIVCLSGERVAIFKYEGKVSAVSNVCQHQNGPLGESRIVDGCITCPWHGYQYLPETGASPPPFVEKVPTFNVRVQNGRVLVHPKPNPAGVRAAPALNSAPQVLTSDNAVAAAV